MTSVSIIYLPTAAGSDDTLTLYSSSNISSRRIGDGIPAVMSICSVAAAPESRVYLVGSSGITIYLLSATGIPFAAQTTIMNNSSLLLNLNGGTHYV